MRDSQDFKDKEHDTDSCMDVWQNFYGVVYADYWDKYLDFSVIDDRETSAKCKRWYIKIRDDLKEKQLFPQFKMSGDCIFNFNEKKVHILEKMLVSDEGKKLLMECAQKHHSFDNFAFMPITGGMNNTKGRQTLDRPDKHIKELYCYFQNKPNNIFNIAGKNTKALEWYLSLFDQDIMKYMERIYLIKDEEFVYEKLLPFADVEIKDEKSAVEYMYLAKEFWSKRDILLTGQL